MGNQVLRPSGIGFYNGGWTAEPGGTARWEAIDDVTPDEDVTYVTSATVNDAFTVRLTDMDLLSFPRPLRIPGITLIARVRAEIANPTTFRFRVRYLGVDYDSVDLTFTSDVYIDVPLTLVTLPDGNAWNTLKLNNLEIGLVYVSGETLRCTKVELHVHTELFPHITQSPESDGFYAAGWTPVPGGADRYMHLTAPFDGNLSYLSSVVAADEYTAELTDLGAMIFPPTIDRVRASALVRNVDLVDPATIKVRMRSGGSDFDGATTTDGHVIPPDSVWVPIYETWVNEPTSGFPSGNPAGVDWVVADANALEIGVVNDVAGPEVRVTSMESEVWLRYTPVTSFDALPTADGFHTDLPPIVPNGGEAAWEDVDETPPDDAVTYIGGDADAANTILYATFDTDADTFVLAVDEQIFNVEVRLRIRLGATSSAVVAPLIRWAGETFMGSPVRIEGTGATWFDVKEDFFANPITGAKWTTGTLDAEYGMAVISGEAFLSRVRAQVQTAPLIVGASSSTSFLLTDDADTFIARAAGGDGTVYAVTEFAIGTGGYDPTDPKTIVPVVKADTALASEVARFPLTKVTYDFTSSPKRVWYWCRVPRDVALDRIGEVGLFATIYDSPFPAEIGTSFMFGLCHMPVQCRHENDVHLYILRVDYP